MNNQRPLISDEGQKQTLAEIGLTPERVREISDHVKELFNHGDSKAPDVMRTLVQTYKEMELVFASMGYHNLLKDWEQRRAIQSFLGGTSSQ